MDFKGLIRHIAYKIVGLQQYEEEIDTLHYFIDKYMDISDFPQAEGELRNLQVADAIMIAIIDKIFRANNLQYWLTDGSLLGGVRHNGFIPWDDDTDIAMTRDDYDRVVPILNEKLSKYEFDVKVEANRDICRIGIGYKHELTGVWVDIFPVDYTSYDANASMERSKLQHILRKYKSKLPNFNETHQIEIEKRLRKNSIPGLCEKNEAKSLIFASSKKGFIVPYECVFPLGEMDFECYKFMAPNNKNEYLESLFGKNYMCFPKSGVLHHGNKEKGSIKDWAKVSGIDMLNIISELTNIYDTL